MSWKRGCGMFSWWTVTWGDHSPLLIVATDTTSYGDLAGQPQEFERKHILYRSPNVPRPWRNKRCH